MGILRDVARAFKPSSIARGLDAARNPPSQAEIDAAVAQLPPEQRAAYEANMAEVRRGQEESQRSWEEAKAISDRARVLDGPAGRYAYGSGMGDFGSPDDINRQIAEQGAMSVVKQMRAQRKGEFKQGLRQSFGIQEVGQIDDPAERVRVAAEERAQRDAARQPYRAPNAAPLAISRLATRGATQLAELLGHLEASGHATRPDLVFGVYRVPDRISGPLTPHSEQGRVVEWDIVHSPLPDGEAAGGPAPCVASSFVADEQWVARRVGERSILDEDLAYGFCRAAGIGPERCLGLARVSEFRHLKWSGDDDDLRTIVKGVVAIHPPESSGAFERLRAEAPLALADPADSGVHVEVLNWEAIAKAVHLKIHHPPPVPSPFPYLPATPQELLRAYLEVVGVLPADSYSAQATVDHPSRLVQGGFLTTNLGPKQPCADGKDRMRTHGCQQVILVYRDRPEYAEGRERWSAYQRDVLQAALGHGMRLRPPLAVDDLSDVPRVLRGVVRAEQALDRIEVFLQEKLPPYRYCWPPAG